MQIISVTIQKTTTNLYSRTPLNKFSLGDPEMVATRPVVEHTRTVSQQKMADKSWKAHLSTGLNLRKWMWRVTATWNGRNLTASLDADAVKTFRSDSAGDPEMVATHTRRLDAACMSLPIDISIENISHT